MVCVEQIIGGDLIVVVCSVGKAAAAVAVTQGPNARHVGLQLIVNQYVATLVGCNPGAVETQVVRIWSTSHCQKNVSAYHVRRSFVAINADGDPAVAPLQGYTFRIRPNPDPLQLQDLPHGFGNILIFTSDQARSHLYNRDFASEAAIHLTEFQPDVTAADNDEMFRQK